MAVMRIKTEIEEKIKNKTQNKPQHVVCLEALTGSKVNEGKLESLYSRTFFPSFPVISVVLGPEPFCSPMYLYIVFNFPVVSDAYLYQLGLVF